jgi:hypothetical protein
VYRHRFQVAVHQWCASAFTFGGNDPLDRSTRASGRKHPGRLVSSGSAERRTSCTSAGWRCPSSGISPAGGARRFAEPLRGAGANQNEQRLSRCATRPGLVSRDKRLRWPVPAPSAPRGRRHQCLVATFLDGVIDMLSARCCAHRDRHLVGPPTACSARSAGGVTATATDTSAAA